MATVLDLNKHIITSPQHNHNSTKLQSASNLVPSNKLQARFTTTKNVLANSETILRYKKYKPKIMNHAMTTTSTLNINNATVSITTTSL